MNLSCISITQQSITLDELDVPTASSQWWSIRMNPKVTTTGFVVQAIVEPSDGIPVLGLRYGRIGKL